MPIFYIGNCRIQSLLFCAIFLIASTISPSLYAQDGTAIPEPTCATLNTFYQTVGKSNAVEIYKFNGYDSFELLTILTDHGLVTQSAPASAFSSRTGYLYIANNTTANLILNVYDPNNNFEYKGQVRFEATYSTYRDYNNLFTTPEGKICIIKGDQMLIGDLTSTPPLITGIVSEIPKLTTSNKTMKNFETGHTCADYVYYNKKVYGMSRKDLGKRISYLNTINFETGEFNETKINYGVDIYSGDPIGSTKNFGAVWIDTKGNFFYSFNPNGRIFKLDNIANSTSSSIGKIWFQATASNSNDGFACESLDLTPKVTVVPPTCTSLAYAYIPGYKPLEYIYTFKKIEGGEVVAATGISILTDGRITGLDAGIQYIMHQKSISELLEFEDDSAPFTIANGYLSLPNIPTIIGSEVCSPETEGSITLNNPEAEVTHELFNADNVIVSTATKQISENSIIWTNVPIGNNYYVKASSSIECISSSNKVNVTQNSSAEKPTLSLIRIPSCLNPTGDIEITNYDHNLVYTVTGTILNTDTRFSTTAAPRILTNLFPGTYTVTATTSQGCTNIEIATIFIESNTDRTEIPTIDPIIHIDCNNLSGSIIVKTPLSGTGIEYILKSPLLPNGEVKQDHPEFTNLQAGTYSLVIREGICYSDPLTPIEIKIATVPAVNYETIKPKCIPNKGSIIVTAPLGDFKYRLVGTGDTLYPSKTQTELTFANLSAGTYKIVAINATNQCESSEVDITLITDNTPPITARISTPNQPTCYIPTGTFNILSPIGAYEYILKKPADPTFSIQKGTLEFDSINPGTYELFVKSNSNGCTSSIPLIITIYDRPEVPLPNILIVDQSDCISEIKGSITVATQLDHNYTLTYHNTTSLPALNYCVQNSTGLFTELRAGSYSLKIKNTLNGCERTEDLEILPFAGRPLILDPDLIQPTCELSTGTITITQTAEYFSFDGGLTFDTDPQKNDLAPGTYYIAIKDLMGCSSSLKEVIIQPKPVRPTPPQYILELPTCEVPYASITITVQNDSDVYSFDNGLNWQIDPSKNFLVAGDFFLKVKNSVGCISDMIGINIPTPPKVPSLPEVETIQPTCTSSNNEIFIKDQNNTDQYSFDGGTSWESINRKANLEPGIYQIRIKNIQGCISINKEIIINDLPTIPATPQILVQPITCTTEKGEFTILNFSSELLYTLSRSGDSTDGITIMQATTRNLQIGEYKISAISKLNNCFAVQVASFQMNEAACPKIKIVKTAVFNDENNDHYATADETVTYNFLISNIGNVDLRNISLTDLLPGINISKQGDTFSLKTGESNENFYSATYKLTAKDIINGKISNTANVKAESDEGIVQDASTVTLLLDKGTMCDIIVYNLVMPNANSRNSVFEIGGLNCYPDNTVEIFNRWGVRVFETSRYDNKDNAFKGISHGRSTYKINEMLPSGTYYYILNYKDDQTTWHKKAGYLYLNK